MAINPIAGIGVTPVFSNPALDDEGKVKKFTSPECLELLMQKIQDEPEIVRNQYTIFTKEESGEMTTKFWPAIFDAANWTRISTHRPKEDENGEKIFGTDREVREYENDFWADHRHLLVGTVTTEHGEVHSITVVAKW